VSIVFRWCTL